MLKIVPAKSDRPNGVVGLSVNNTRLSAHLGLFMKRGKQTTSSSNDNFCYVCHNTDISLLRAVVLLRNLTNLIGTDSPPEQLNQV